MLFVSGHIAKIDGKPWTGQVGRELSTEQGVLIWRTLPDEAKEIYSAIDAGLKAGTLQPVVGLELPLADAAESHRRVMESGALGKIVLIP